MVVSMPADWGMFRAIIFSAASPLELVWVKKTVLSHHPLSFAMEGVFNHAVRVHAHFHLSPSPNKAVTLHSCMNPVGSPLSSSSLFYILLPSCSFSVLCPAKPLNGYLAMANRAHRSRPTGEIVVNMEPEVPIKKMETMVKLEAVSIPLPAPL